MRYKNPNDVRTTVYLTEEQKKFICKENMNLSYFVRERLESFMRDRKVKS